MMWRMLKQCHTLNPFRVKKALKQAEHYVTEVRQINDELNKIAREQTRIIAEQTGIIMEKDKKIIRQQAQLDSCIQQLETNKGVSKS